MIHSRILGTGSYLPERIVTNSELAALVDTTDDANQGTNRELEDFTPVHLGIGVSCGDLAVAAGDTAFNKKKMLVISVGAQMSRDDARGVTRS